MRVRASDYATRARWRSSTAKAEGMACACPSEELCFGEEGVVNDIAVWAGWSWFWNGCPRAMPQTWPSRRTHADASASGFAAVSAPIFPAPAFSDSWPSLLP